MLETIPERTNCPVCAVDCHGSASASAYLAIPKIMKIRKGRENR